MRHKHLQKFSEDALQNLLLMNGIVCKLMRKANQLFEESIEFVWHQENIESANEESSFKNKKRVTAKPDVKLKLKKGVVIHGQKSMMPMLTFGVFNKGFVCDFHEDLMEPFALDLDFIVNNHVANIRKKYWPTYRYHLNQINKLNRVSFYLTQMVEMYRDTCCFFTQKQPVKSSPSTSQINALFNKYKSLDNALFSIVDSCYDLAVYLNEAFSVITKAEKKEYDDNTKEAVEKMKTVKDESVSGYSLNPVIVSPKRNEVKEVNINGRIYLNAKNVIDLRHYRGKLTNNKARSVYIKRKKGFSKGYYYPVEFITRNKNYYLHPHFIPFVERIVESVNFLNDKNVQLNRYRKELFDLLLYLDDNKVDFVSDD
jgi:hypothetical protein